jgi:ATP-binding cassette, subfamily B, bacterial
MNTQQPHEYDFRNAITNNRLKGLWRMMTGFRLPYLGATISLTIAALARTGNTLVLRYFADTLIKAEKAGTAVNQLSRTLVLVAFGFLVLAVVEGASSFLSGRLSSFTAEGITRRMRNYLFDHIQRLPFTYHDQTPTGEIIERSTSDVDALRRFFADQAIGVGRIAIIFVINFTAMATLSLKLALVSVIAMPVIVGVSIFFFRLVTKAYEAYQEQEAKLSTTLQENLTGVRVVKAFARQDYEKNKFEKDNLEKFKLGKKLLRMHTMFWPLSDIICSVQMIGGYAMAALMVIHGDMTPGSYLMYVGLLGWLIWPMRNLGRLIVQASSGLVSFNRVMDIIKRDVEPLTEGTYQTNEKTRGEFIFKDVSFKYADAEEVILKNISFTCKPGQSIALLGSTGSGKTTLMNLLPRFYDYTSGSLTLDGVELKEYHREYLRSQIGIVEQEPFLFSRTIRENICYGVGREVPLEEIEAAARAAAIHDVIMDFPDGYNTLVGEKGVTLSGGQKQRTAIARTLLKNPRILILDDSTSSVDTETEASIREALNRLMENRTTFIIAHRIQSVMNAHQIIVLDKGQIVQMGNHAELLAQEGMYRQIYNIQTRIESELEQEIADTVQIVDGMYEHIVEPARVSGGGTDTVVAAD